MKNSETYFRNFESIDNDKKSILFIAGAGMDHRLVRSLKLPDAEFNKPLIIDLPGHGDSKGTSSNTIESYSKFLIECFVIPRGRPYLRCSPLSHFHPSCSFWLANRLRSILLPMMEYTG